MMASQPAQPPSDGDPRSGPEPETGGPLSRFQDLPLEENVQYDFYYIKNRSLIMDISIVLRTVPALLSRKGAY